MSIEEPIAFMAAQLEAMPFFTTVYGLCELLDNGNGIEQPVYFVTDSIKPQEVKINKLGAAYFRKREAFTISQNQDNNYRSCDTLYRINCPLRLVAFTKRKDFPGNNAYAADRLSGTLIRAITNENGQLKRDMNVNRVLIRATTYSTDLKTIREDEFRGIQNPQFNFEDIAVALDVDVTIDSYSDCIEEACEYIPNFCLELETKIALPDA